ncbi:RNA-binding protein 34-like [Bombus pyrosoma]|uniref:RNA-binding protein 34-like n=1 Tax=Bombus pyrosoma TaxID=396416 RepID=UPI001CB9963D|nr:RNA-binding protein 34-like [Bombus pyrosoma]XP_043582740.1 RNA-binding protein 34-like [Bombus pyrosoma]
MVKSQPKEDKSLTSKHLLNVPKDGFIQKNKNKKFKQIPTGKVPLINESKKSNSNNMKNNIPQKSPEKNKGLRKKDIEKLQESLKKQRKNKNFGGVKEDESINEGIVLQDSIIENSDESESFDDNKSEEENILPDILGASLANDSDEDDEDYEEDKKVQVNKGVKMFDGIKSNDSIVSSEDKDDSMTEDSEDDDDDDDDYDDDDDDEEEDDTDDTEDTESEYGRKTDESSLGSLKVLLGDSLSEDEDDEDFADFDENNETDDTSDEEDEELKNEGSDLLKTLIGDTIIEDDNDDDDFVEPTENDEDDDISDEEDEEQEEGEVEGNGSLNSHEDKDSSLKDFEENERTIFVGNLPKDVTKKQLQKLFKQFGKIDAIRLRGKISKSLNIPKRVAAITNDLHPKVKSVYAYIRFDSEESTKKALSINGRKFEGNYIRVDMSSKSNDKYETKKSVFIGNLHFNVDDDSVRNHFKRCGEIESVRIIRDNQTGVGKGFGYVNFKSEDAVALALELDGTTILNREVRVKPSIEKDKRTKGKCGKRYSSDNNHKFSHKKLKNTVGSSVTIRNKENAVKRITKKQNFERKETSPQQQGNNFQGQKSDVNKKKSKNKFDKKKKLLAEKLMAKPKKSSN